MVNSTGGATVPDPTPTLGAALKAARINAGFETQPAAVRALAARGLEITPRLLCAYETGQAKPPYKKLHALAALYGESYARLCLLAVWS
jgi:transcriptional regulator with XRE-family HTH domain